MFANVTQTRGAQQRIAQRMDHHVPVRVRHQPAVKVNPNAAEYNMITIAKRMHVVSMANPHHVIELLSF
jgi:hypothetical protein